MRPPALHRPTIGFLSTWSVYDGTTIDHYTRTLQQGICAAAHDQQCNLLLGCGIGLPATPRSSRTAWAVAGPSADFVPVGPWNTDGLIIIPDDLTDTQFADVQGWIRSGFPIVLTTPEKPGPVVAVDNVGGIHQALDHLFQHGHRQIAYIAGKSGRGGDSAERLAAYRQTLCEVGIEIDERLIAFGEHRHEDGRRAMQQIIDTNAPFTAVLASNDLSGLGAMDALQSIGRRIPDDVAVIGFDDILDARSHFPPLTTVRHPTFTLGYEAVLSLLDTIAGKQASKSPRVPTQLIIRQSCGCRPMSNPSSLQLPNSQGTALHPSGQESVIPNLQSLISTLGRTMAEATLLEARHSTQEEIERLCLDLLDALLSAVNRSNPALFDEALRQLFHWLETHDEEPYAWYAALSALRQGLPSLLTLIPDADMAFANHVLDHARREIDEQVQRQSAATLLRHMEMSDRLGLMTSQLLTVLDAAECASILANHLPQLGLNHILLALYLPEADDPYAQAQVLLDAGFSPDISDRQFATRDFPPPSLYPADKPYQLALLPLIIDEQTTGFAAFSATNLDLCAAIVHNLAAVLRTSQLYREALESRQVAEEANRLKSRFLSMVSHELRTPLSLIVGLSELVVAEQRAERRTEQHDQLRDAIKPANGMLRDVQQINAAAQHLARMIGDVLDIASSEAGQLRIQREPLDLADVLRVTAEIGEQLAADKGLLWQAHLPPRGPWVLGDRTRLRQIVLNLIANAVKFTPAGTIALQVKTEDTLDGEGIVTVSVSDTGIGVQPDEQVTLFREFQRTERSVRAGFDGLGLGLAITKQLVAHHGGTIGVCSPGDLGPGSTFFFTLPVLATADPANTLSPLPADESVALLTDQGDDSDPLYHYLCEQGFHVRLYRLDEETAWLPHLIASPPLAVIVNEQLAAREGWLIVGMLKRQATTRLIPVLVYSLDIESNKGELLELNYLPKPLHPEQLAQELARFGETTRITDSEAEGDEQRIVLVVDDDPGILDAHCRLVEQHGCRALCARDGREALAIIEQTRPDLILLDLMMPVMDGFAVLDVLRSRETTRDIPVIILTAQVLSDADVERLNRGVAAILSKGLFDSSETLRHIDAALAHQRSLGSSTQRLVRRAMAYIHTHFAESPNREAIAGHVGISPDYLTDCFRQELGITPIAYLNRYRIRQARELLASSDSTITQVALSVGFSDSAHFTRTFQREVGLTPSAYRHGQRK